MSDFQRKLKEGEILRYKSGFLGKKWKECWAVLFSDSEFIWFDKKGDSKPAGSVFLKDVVPYTCVGPMCDRMPVNDVICTEIPDADVDKDLREVVTRNMIHGPYGSLNLNLPCMIDGKCSKRYPRALVSNTQLQEMMDILYTEVRRPELPPRYSLYHLVGIGMDSQASKVHWFLFSSDSDLESWFTEIMKTLPKPNPPPADASAQQLPTTGSKAPPPTYSPPPVYPSSPPQVANTYPSQPVYNPATNPAQSPMYPTAVPNYGGGAPGGGGSTTVIIADRNGGGGYGPRYGDGGSSGPGLGTGMLMGSLLGFGLGSVWGGGLHSGFGFGGHHSCPPMGMGSGFGGGYVQDNDTFITNNYYNIGPESGGTSSERNTESSTVDDPVNNPNTTQDYYDGYDVGVGGDYNDSGDYDIGGGYDDSGGYDVGGGDDFGGGDFGDFGGGDW
uniref:PH domain-containing protein n=1 Tax=Onchocerca volvulus TaxID=6282 RepID=A0A2K6W8Q6_ONCVO